MGETDRTRMTRLVYQRLADARFRRCLTAADPDDGTHPIIVALRDDLMRALTEKIGSAGGSANVVIPVLNGFIVLAMECEPGESGPDSEVLTPNCTVGLFVERLHIDDEGTTYHLADEDERPRPESGRARLVALG